MKHTPAHPGLLAATLAFAGLGLHVAPAVALEQPPPARPVPPKVEILDGPFQPTWESLKQYRCPDWFRDAKLGIWGILTPQSLPEAGDWYARHMYIEGMEQYLFHVERFGHPSRFGYKDLAAMWKLDRFDPDRLMDLYERAGARYFVVLANHHDNYDNWNSRYHRWNSVNVGPHKDIVGLWAKAAREHGLRFGVTEHVARSYSWFNTNKGRDEKGPLAGVPYDGNDPAYEDLYFPPHEDTTYTYPANPPEWWPRQWFWRMRDLIDTYHPDLMYSDGAVPFGEVGRSLFAHFYNASMAWHGGKLEAVYNIKDMAPRTDHGEYVDGIGVQDVERGILGGIKAEPWQTDTCIGNWFYKTGLPYKPVSQVICMLADIVSKNGNLLLNIPLKHDGSIDAQEEKVLADLGAWMAVNGEAIHGTRPWKAFGEGRPQGGGHFNEDGQRYGARDIRFTTKGDALYALVLGWPSDGRALVRSLATGAGVVSKVGLLGHDGDVAWTQTEVGLQVVLPAKRPCEHAFALKIVGRELQPVPVSGRLLLSDAHLRSGFAVIDPVYSATALTPPPDHKPDAAPWLYGEAEVECWRLQVLRERMKAAKLNVGYPGVFHEALPRVSFRCSVLPGQHTPESLILRAVGGVVVRCGERIVYRGADGLALHHITLPEGSPSEARSIQVDLETNGEPPAILIEEGPLATGLAPWQWSGDGAHWGAAVAFRPTRSGLPPHRIELPEVTLKPVGRVGELYDFGREVLGRVAFRAQGTPALFVGESALEARNDDPRHFEQSPALASDGEGRWISEHPLAFRYVRITGSEPVELECRALFHPARYRGAFACSDERLTRLWMHAAYTHRLCQLDFVLDGIKRDRLPWVDNMILSAAVESHAFGDPELLRRTLTVMGRTADRSDINGIVDYNFLWVIGHDALQRYFTDSAYLRREWPRIQAMIERVAASCDANGLVRPPRNAWVFIDWVEFDKSTSLQMMWLWAQRAGARLAERMGDSATAAAWTRRADALEGFLHEKAWDDKAGAWTDPDKPVPPSRHAQVLSMVSGLARPAQYPGILKVIRGDQAEPLNSPSMIYYEILALAQGGEPAAARARLGEVWGAMLDRGATTFWEGYSPEEKGDDAYAFYGRPFGKSLCHAWGAGPVVLLPQLILGLRPTADGWKRFSVAPSLGDLKWACATVPTPQGDVEVVAEDGWLELHVPAGATAECGGKEFAGPCSAKVELR